MLVAGLFRALIFMFFPVMRENRETEPIANGPETGVPKGAGYGLRGSPEAEQRNGMGAGKPRNRPRSAPLA